MIINLLYTKYIENETKYKTLKFKSTWSAKIRRPKGHYETKVTAPMDGVMQRPFFCTQGRQFDFYPIRDTKIDTKV